MSKMKKCIKCSKEIYVHNIFNDLPIEKIKCSDCKKKYNKKENIMDEISTENILQEYKEAVESFRNYLKDQLDWCLTSEGGEFGQTTEISEKFEELFSGIYE